MSAPAVPSPHPDDLTQPFWEAASRERLVIQRCARCGVRFHPPVPFCGACSSTDMGFAEVLGTGTVESFCVIPDQARRHVVVWVRLDDDPGIIVVANLIDAEADEVRFELPVQVAFERLDAQITLPQFRPWNRPA